MLFRSARGRASSKAMERGSELVDRAQGVALAERVVGGKPGQRERRLLVGEVGELTPQERKGLPIAGPLSKGRNGSEAISRSDIVVPTNGVVNGVGSAATKDVQRRIFVEQVVDTAGKLEAAVTERVTDIHVVDDMRAETDGGELARRRAEGTARHTKDVINIAGLEADAPIAVPQCVVERCTPAGLEIGRAHV